MGHVQTSRLIPAPVADVYAYLLDVENIPDDLRSHLDLSFPSTPPAIQGHSEIEANLKRFGVTSRVIVRIEEVVPQQRITYRLIEGVFKHWRHRIVLQEHSSDTTLLTDIVDFSLPLGVLGAIADDLLIRREVRKILEARLHHIEEYFNAPGAWSFSLEDDTMEREEEAPSQE